MSEFVNWLNAAGEAFVTFGTRMVVQSSVLILALLVLDLILRRRVKAVVRYWIWLLVLVKLVLPPSLSSPTSLAWWLGAKLPEPRAILTDASVEQPKEVPTALLMTQTAPGEIVGAPATADPGTLPAATNESEPRAPTWQALLLAGWLAVVVVMLVLLIQRATFVRGLVLQSQESPERLRDLLDRCRRQMKVRTPVQLRLTSLSASPSVCGLIRPTILVPQRMLSQLNGAQLRSILLHELAHIRRADLWANLAQTLLQIAYVYHPLVWPANAVIRRVREQAVDETVLAAMGDEAEEYPRTLLSVSKLAFNRPALSLRLVGVVESKRTLTARIKHIADRPFPTSARLGVAGLVLVLTVGAMLLPMAKARHSETKDTPDPRELLDRYRNAVTCWDKSVSMRIEYDHSMNYRGTDIRRWKYDISHRRDGDRCEWFGRHQFEGKDEGRPYSFNEEFRNLISDDYFLYYSQRDSGDKTEAIMGADVGETLFMLQAQSADGGFLQGRTGGIGTATHQAQVMCDSNDVQYVGHETLGGTPCHVVKARTQYGTFTVWLAPEKGDNALKSVWSKRGRDILRDSIRIEDQGIVEWTETLDDVDVQRIDGVFFPVSGRLTGYTKFTDGETSEDHTTARRSEIVLHPDFGALGAFQIVLPEGTEVRLKGVPQHQFRWSNGKFTPDLFKYLMKSLVGKPLPGLDAIRTDPDTANAAGKILVVCFFDVQQRPSRNCMVQLAQEAEVLTKKGAVILGVQSAKMEDGRFREWLQENNIQVPTGTVQADEEQTRCAWGVQSLPWLILTDRDRIVRAEGFDLHELQSRIESIEPAPPPASDTTGTTISGLVIDTAGKPIPEAYVSIENADLLLLPEPQKFGAQIRRVTRPNSARTDSQGHFRFTDLNPGKTDISVAAPGYRTESVANVATGTEGLRIVLGEPRPYQLSGVVLDTSGRGIEGVEVTLVEETLSGPGRGSSAPPLAMRTDGSGAFHLGKLLAPADRQSVRRFLFARKQGYGVWGEDLDTTGGQTSLRITLQTEETVSGVVNDEAGKPIADATVTLYSGWGSYGNFWFSPTWQHLAPQAKTGADGSFILSQLPTESDVHLRVNARGYASGEMTSVRTGRFGGYAIRRGSGTMLMGNATADPNAPLVITLQKAVTLRGAVVYKDAGDPAPGIRVATQAQDGGVWSETVTDAGGRFEMTGVSPVPCNLLVMIDEPARDVMPEWTAAAVRLNDLQPGETRDGIKLVLTQGNIIHGRVTDSQGQPLQGIDIAFYSAARPRPGAACQSILTGADGTWAYRFPPGEVYVYVRTNLAGASWQRKNYTYTLAAGQTIENVDFILNQEVPEGSRNRGVLPDGNSRAPLPSGPRTEWPVSAGGNGHSYRVVRVAEGLTWDEAKQAAEREGGYLATITSAEENAFVFSLIQNPLYWNGPRGPWIGGRQPPGRTMKAGWTWVTGEPFAYSNWSLNQPNDSGAADETRLHYGWGSTTITDTWNDQPDWYRGIHAYVVEIDSSDGAPAGTPAFAADTILAER